MAREKILSVGYNFPGGRVERIRLDSDQSLLDADIVVFRPGFYYDPHLSHQGKPLFDEEDSLRVRESLAHWHRELTDALNAGKTVLVLLAKLEEALAYTGEQMASGTGRNRQVPRGFRPVSSYQVLPFPSLKFLPASGSEIRAARDLHYLNNYWHDYSPLSPYEGHLEGGFDDKEIILKTRSGDRIVGVEVRRGHGTLLLIPPLRYNLGIPIEEDGEWAYREWDEEDEVWSDEADQFGRRLIDSLVQIHRALRSEVDITPPPDWSSDPAYRLEREDQLEAAIQATSSKIDLLQAEQRELEGGLREVRALRRLLYEQGNQLEEAILDALKLFGFDAEPYQDADSEFDSVFKSPEGRFLGEAEGKDKRPIHINKLRQLRLNLDEDFARDEVEEYAKGVLFGNPHRFQPLNKRPGDFTAKCYTSAKHSKIALVRTADMFEPARYLSENNDPEYAQLCRKAIHECEGQVVEFPAPPRG